MDDLLVAEAIREAVLGVAGVQALSPGIGYLEATYGRGSQVRGVGFTVENGSVVVNVHLIVAETPIPALAPLIRRVVRMTIERETDLPPGPVNLYIDDMMLGTTMPGEHRA